MLKSHMSKMEKVLIGKSEIAHNMGHFVNKGTAREIFINEFLANHLSEKVRIGTGQIISHQSKPSELRNQIDIVIYRHDYPKLNIGKEINCYLAESVIATIEVKSTLDKSELEKSIIAASKIKKIPRHIITTITTGYQPPAILNYVVAYDSAAKMETVYNWISKIHQTAGITTSLLPINKWARKSIKFIYRWYFCPWQGFCTI